MSPHYNATLFGVGAAGGGANELGCQICGFPWNWATVAVGFSYIYFFGLKFDILHKLHLNACILTSIYNLQITLECKYFNQPTANFQFLTSTISWQCLTALNFAEILASFFLKITFYKFIQNQTCFFPFFFVLRSEGLTYYTHYIEIQVFWPTNCQFSSQNQNNFITVLNYFTFYRIGGKFMWFECFRTICLRTLMVRFRVWPSCLLKKNLAFSCNSHCMNS